MAETATHPIGTARRPLHLHYAAVATVCIAAFFGAAAREWLEQAVTSPASGFPWATWIINISGAFVLGLLLAALARAGSDDGWRRRLRLAGGTGFLGAFTTYSTFAVETDLLLKGSHVVTGVIYALATVLAGLVACYGGIRLSGLLFHNWPSGQLPVDPDTEDPFSIRGRDDVGCPDDSNRAEP